MLDRCSRLIEYIGTLPQAGGTTDDHKTAKDASKILNFHVTQTAVHAARAARANLARLETHLYPMVEVCEK